jgi:hypothetical protein
LHKIIEENERLRLLTIERGEPERFKGVEQVLYFTRSSMGKVHPHATSTEYVRRGYVKRIDPILERKRINCWGKSVGAVFEKKFISKEEKVLIQRKVML